MYTALERLLLLGLTDRNGSVVRVRPVWKQSLAPHGQPAAGQTAAVPLAAVIEAGGESRFEWLVGARKREYAGQLLGSAIAALQSFLD